MNATRAKRGFTMVEMVVVIAILAVVLVLLFPAISSNRESAQEGLRASAIKSRFGLAMQNYAATFHNSFPPSATIRKDTKEVCNYSFLVKLLSFMDYETLYMQLPQSEVDFEHNSNRFPGGSTQTQYFAHAMHIQMKEFLCPDSPGRFPRSTEVRRLNHSASPATRPSAQPAATAWRSLPTRRPTRPTALWCRRPAPHRLIRIARFTRPAPTCPLQTSMTACRIRS